MAVATIVVPDIYAGDGATTEFPITFGAAFDDNAHIEVTFNDAAGVVTILVLNTDYAITGSISAGFKVDFAGLMGAPPANTIIAIRRNQPALQEIPFNDQVKFPASRVAAMGDRQARASQDLSALLDLAIKMPVTEYGAGPFIFPSSVMRSNKVFAFDANGDPDFSISTVDVSVVAGIASEIATLAVIAAEIVTVADPTVVANINAAPANAQSAADSAAQAAISEGLVTQLVLPGQYADADAAVAANQQAVVNSLFTNTGGLLHRITSLSPNVSTVVTPVAFATQVEAEAGTDNTKSMTPLRSAQAIAALSAYTGFAATKKAFNIFTPLERVSLLDGAQDTAAAVTKATVDAWLTHLNADDSRVGFIPPGNYAFDAAAKLTMQRDIVIEASRRATLGYLDQAPTAPLLAFDGQSLHKLRIEGLRADVAVTTGASSSSAPNAPTALSLDNLARGSEICGFDLKGADDYWSRTGGGFLICDSLITPVNCPGLRIFDGVITGGQDTGIYNTGGGLLAATDDDVRLQINNVDFYGCANSVVTKRAGYGTHVKSCRFFQNLFGVTEAWAASGSVELDPGLETEVEACFFKQTERVGILFKGDGGISRNNTFEDWGYSNQAPTTPLADNLAFLRSYDFGAGAVNYNDPFIYAAIFGGSGELQSRGDTFRIKDWTASAAGTNFADSIVAIKRRSFDYPSDTPVADTVVTVTPGRMLIDGPHFDCPRGVYEIDGGPTYVRGQTFGPNYAASVSLSNANSFESFDEHDIAKIGGTRYGFGVIEDQAGNTLSRARSSGLQSLSFRPLNSGSKQIDGVLTDFPTVSFGSIAANTVSGRLNIPLTGVTSAWHCIVTLQSALPDGIVMCNVRPVTDNVQVQFFNNTAGAITVDNVDFDILAIDTN